MKSNTKSVCALTPLLLAAFAHTTSGLADVGPSAPIVTVQWDASTLNDDPDSDADGIADSQDNCPRVFDPLQIDSDGDGWGDVCTEPESRDVPTELVARFNPNADRGEYANCHSVHKVNDRIIAASYSRGQGCEPHVVRQDGSSRRLADIFPGEGSSLQFGLIHGATLGEWFYFAALDDTHGHEWWRTDGRSAELVMDINPGAAHAFDFPQPWVVGGWLLFIADDGSHGPELWRTDGATTELLHEFVAGEAGFRLRYSTSYQGRMYFSGSLGPDFSDSFIYSTDGSSVREEGPIGLQNRTASESMEALSQGIFMAAHTPEEGQEPWVLNRDGVRLLEDLVSGPGDSDCCDRRVRFGDSLVFNAVETAFPTSPGTGFYRTDGRVIEALPHSGIPIKDIDLKERPSAFRSFISNRRNTLSYNVSSPAILYADAEAYQEAAPVPNPVLRVDQGATHLFELDNETDLFAQRISYAALGDHTLALVDGELHRLYASTAHRSPLHIPTDWDGSTFEFLRGGAMTGFTLIEETSAGGASRTWLWSFNETGLLRTADGEPLARFRWANEFDGMLYFYADDPLEGYGLRRMPAPLAWRTPVDAALTGTWYDPATAGQGFVVHQIDDTTSLFSFYGFEDDGQPLWLIGVGGPEVGLFRAGSLELIAASGGAFGGFEPGDITEQAWGSLTIAFEACDRATAVLSGLSGTQELELQRLAGLQGLGCAAYTAPTPELAGITGTWFEPATSGQGLVLHAIDDGHILLSFYGYRDGGERLWLIGVFEGAPEFGKDLVASMITATGGRFGGFTPDEVTENDWGTLTIRFTDCGTASATLDGLDGRQSLELVKLAGLQGSGVHCP